MPTGNDSVTPSSCSELMPHPRDADQTVNAQDQYASYPRKTAKPRQAKLKHKRTMNMRFEIATNAGESATRGNGSIIFCAQAGRVNEARWLTEVRYRRCL
jgi:hypothetical protein